MQNDISEHVMRFCQDRDAFCEATHYERHRLWYERAIEAVGVVKYSLLPEDAPKRVRWTDLPGGISVMIGELLGRHIVIDMVKARIDEATVVFWSPTSVLVDYEMINRWFKDLNKKLATPHMTLDPMNFTIDIGSRTSTTKNSYV